VKKPAVSKTPRRAPKSKSKKLCGCGCGKGVTGKRLYIDDAHKQKAYNKRKQEEATA
jgi:hypothetical protein